MINPGGSVGVTFNRSAATRMNNNLVNGARATLPGPGNQAAQQSLRNQYSKKNPGAPVGPNVNQPVKQMQAPMQASMQQPMELPTGGPQAPPEMGNGMEAADALLDPMAQMEQLIEEVKQKQFEESPRVKDAMEAIRFKNLMNAENPRYQPDSRSLFEQVVARIGMG